MTPSFLICGGQRCGTTSMYRALAAHPVVLKAVLHKGVHYFDTSYDRGMDWYRAHFPLQRNADKLTERYGVPAQTFESSPYYMYHPQAAARIARDLPQARLVVLVRDPVERAYSQHHHEVARGFETGTGLRRGARPGAGPAAPAGGAARRGPVLLQLRPPAPRLPGPRRIRPLPERDGPARRPGAHPRGGERAVLRRAGAGLRRGLRVPRPAHLSGAPAVRAAQRPPPAERHGPGAAPRPDRPLPAARRGADPLAGPDADLATSA